MQSAVRTFIVARVYGWALAAGVIPRTVWANWINAHASLKAVYRFARARWRKQALVWVKTEHTYPSRENLLGQRRLLGQILVGSGYISEDDLELGLACKQPGERIGETLVRLGRLTEDDLYEALSLQQNLPAAPVPVTEVRKGAARSLPREVMRQWKVVPFRTEASSLVLATPELPSNEMTSVLRGHTRLNLRFQLITPGNFSELQQHFL